MVMSECSIQVLSHYHEQANFSVNSTILHASEYFRNNNNSARFGKLTDCRNDSEIMKRFHSFRTAKRRTDGGTDNEDLHAIYHFFWGMRDGIVMEIGALNGVKHSNSFPLHHNFNWHRILVEANPLYSSMLSKDSPDAISFGAAICSSQQNVHYISHRVGAVGGIIEFMAESFVRTWHPNVFNKTSVQWEKIHSVSIVKCVPLSTIITETNVKHVNLFILDVEGAELSVLQSIDFNEVVFDVIVVEVELKNRADGYMLSVTTFLKTVGYDFHNEIGRNAWYIHPGYIPSTYLK